jgi:predicted acylesterase/phospholipase RssA
MATPNSSALQVLAGPIARRVLAERGLRAEDIAAIPAAAGGAKGLALIPLDRVVFGRFLPRSRQTVHLVGASIGASRMAAGAAAEPAAAEAALAELSEDYLTQHYEHRPGRRPDPAHVSAVFAQKLEQRLGPRAAGLLASPRFRLHVFTSRGRHLLAREGRVRTPVGWAAAFFANAAARRALGGVIERVVFSDARSSLPVPMGDFRTQVVALTRENLVPAVLASCSIPFWLRAVHDIPGAPRGAYWDGGITDYHLRLAWDRMAGDGLVLYPHFQREVIPGWLDKPWKRRHRGGTALARVVMLVPRPEWIAKLPGGRLPSREDFLAYGDDHAGRQRAWRRAVAESERLAEAFEALVEGGRPVLADPLD